MTAEVRAWARDRLARTLYNAMPIRGRAWSQAGDIVRSRCLADADAVLAVLPELLTDERVVDAAYVTGMVEWHDDAKVILTAAAETLAGAS